MIIFQLRNEFTDERYKFVVPDCTVEEYDDIFSAGWETDSDFQSRMEEKYRATLDGEGSANRDGVWTVGFASTELKDYSKLLDDACDFFVQHGKTWIPN